MPNENIGTFGEREREREGRKIKLGWRKQKDEGPTCRVGAITIVKKRGRTVFPDIFSPDVNFPPYSNPRWMNRNVFSKNFPRPSKQRYGESVIPPFPIYRSIFRPRYSFFPSNNSTRERRARRTCKIWSAFGRGLLLFRGLRTCYED